MTGNDAPAVRTGETPDARLEAAPGRVKVKICGLTRPEDIGAVNAARPDFIGFVFAPQSRRYVALGRAAELRERLDDGIVPVGVFTDADMDEVAGLAARGVVGAVQLHGNEDAGYISRLRRKLPDGMPIIKALLADFLYKYIAVDGDGRPDFPVVDDGDGRPDFLLIDNGGGGTGRAFDWEKLRGLHKDGVLYEKEIRHPGPDPGSMNVQWTGVSIPFFLAGGINEYNVDEAVDVGPYAIDVSSGAESGGVKDAGKIVRIVDAVRNARRRK